MVRLAAKLGARTVRTVAVRPGGAATGIRGHQGAGTYVAVAEAGMDVAVAEVVWTDGEHAVTVDETRCRRFAAVAAAAAAAAGAAEEDSPRS